MKLKQPFASACLIAALALTGAARADTTVELKNTHLCCGSCVAAAKKIVATVEGVTGKYDQKAKTITVTAKDDATAQKAIDALAAGGFHGDTGSKDVAVKEDSGAEKGKVKTLTVTGIHDCCGTCNAAIKGAVKKVDGVTGDTAKTKQDTFDITGDFDAADLVKALNDAGFHVKVKK